jgi:hypothetical protein
MKQIATIYSRRKGRTITTRVYRVIRRDLKIRSLVHKGVE